MTPRVVLHPDAERELERLGAVDLLVGIPSYNNAATIGHVVRAAAAGLAKYFPDARAVIVNSDGGSTDGTPEIAAAADPGPAAALLLRDPPRAAPRLVTPYAGIPGKGSAFRTVFEIARRLGARACAVVDSDLRSITPEWFELLLTPVVDGGFDYVCPLYARHKYDGTITNGIVYPLVRALYGRRIRQPIGGDFGFSGRLAAHWLEHDVWDSHVARYGIDIWMTTTALVGDFRVCQSYLGAKIHDAKDPGAHLSAMLEQVTGALFDQIEAHAHVWPAVAGSQPVPEFGFRYEVGLEPVPVQAGRMVHAFRTGVAELAPLWKDVLPPPALAALAEAARAPDEDFRLPDDLWVEVVYAFAAAYHARRLHPEHLLRSLTPLYLGRTASWVHEAAGYGAADVERALDTLCQRFEALKPGFVESWRRGGTSR